MITENKIRIDTNDIYYKKFDVGSNKTLFLIPGQSLSPRAFWSSHIYSFIKNNINVVMIDPIGYGNSYTEYLPHPYDRDFLHEQLKQVYYSEKTAENTILGFCSTTANALKSCEFGMDKVIILGPAILEETKEQSKGGWFNNTKEKLISERLNKISDKLVPKSIGNFRYPGWDINVPENWQAPQDMLLDIKSYYAKHKNHNISFDICKNVLAIVGEYDYEPQATGGLTLFQRYMPQAKIYKLKNSTHFSMWEWNYKDLIKTIVGYVNDN